MERFIRVHIFRRKSNTFRGITFFAVFTKTTEMFCTIFSGQKRLPFVAEGDLF